MNAERWWTNVSSPGCYSFFIHARRRFHHILITMGMKIIHNTFQPLVGHEQPIHEELAPRLIYRFSSEEGYNLTPGALELLQSLRTRPPLSIERLVIGVITNSDDRVPTVLTSLGLRTSPYRFGTEPITKPAADEQYDIDFAVMSYDAGFEKPDKRIFEAAESMLKVLPSAQGAHDAAEWEKIYVGDEYEKDVRGAADAGWHAVLVTEDGAMPVPEDVVMLEESHEPGSLLKKLRSGESKVAVRNLAALNTLLSGRALSSSLTASTSPR
jgi:FMN phosphatase YigB (HAD superfamily)